jgi:hypothetical protein
MEMELTLSELKTLIKEGVEKLHRKALIENRINQINKELDELLSERKYSEKASNFIGKEISHLMKDKGYKHDRAVAAAINIAKDKGYKVPVKNENEKQNNISLSDDIGLEDDGWLSIEDLANKGLLEKAPSTGLSVKQKSNVVKKAKAGEDIGNKGKEFKDIAAKAKSSGAEDPNAVAAAAMWKNVKRK